MVTLLNAGQKVKVRDEWLGAKRSTSVVIFHNVKYIGMWTETRVLGVYCIHEELKYFE